ncbi:hypothetical protein C7417_2983 [Cupriavidus plantarum]|nr:hypothetical protein C7417_2983 [Cupriavidus plantarum]
MVGICGHFGFLGTFVGNAVTIPPPLLGGSSTTRMSMPSRVPSFTILPLDWTVLGIDGSVAMVNDDNDEAVPSHFARGNSIYALPPRHPQGPRREALPRRSAAVRAIRPGRRARHRRCRANGIRLRIGTVTQRAAQTTNPVEAGFRKSILGLHSWLRGQPLANRPIEWDRLYYRQPKSSAPSRSALLRCHRFGNHPSRSTAPRR